MRIFSASQIVSENIFPNLQIAFGEAPAVHNCFLSNTFIWYRRCGIEMIEAHQTIKLHWLRASRLNPRKELRPTHALHVLISEPDSHLWPLGCTRFRRQDMAHAQERIGGVMSSAVANAEPRIRCRITERNHFFMGDKSLSISTRELSGNFWEKRRELYPAKLLDCRLTSESKEFKARTIWWRWFDEFVLGCYRLPRMRVKVNAGLAAGSCHL